MNFYSDIMTGKFSDLEQSEPCYVNGLGEPFFVIDDQLVKYSPETGDKEVVGASQNKNPLDLLDNYWTAASLVKEWEKDKGPIPKGRILVPKIPFVLGGGFLTENLASVPTIDGLDYYAHLRRQIKDLRDDETVELEATE